MRGGVLEDATVVHSSDVDPERLRQLLADRIAQDQARAFRRFFLTRLGIIVGAVWVFSWPLQVLPHTVVWALLATAALVVGLTSPSRHAWRGERGGVRRSVRFVTPRPVQRPNHHPTR